MKIKFQPSLKSAKGALVVPIFSDDLKKLPKYIPAPVSKILKQLITTKDFTAKRGEILSTYIDEKKLPAKLLLVGFGKGKNYHAKRARYQAGWIGKSLKSAKLKEAAILFPKPLEAHANAFFEALMSAQYDIGKLKSKNSKSTLEKVTFITDSAKPLQPHLERAQIIDTAISMVKDLVNSPSNYVDAETLAKEARRIAKANRYKIAIFKNKELKKMAWGGLLAVNQGCKKDAQAIVLEYNGGKKKESPIVLVGKGIIFDTGGYNMKPGSAMENMHLDMAGGATVLGVFQTLKELGIKKNVVGIIPTAENLVSDTAYRPTDIITMFDGQTVEITNTDAEGRMVLADGLAYGSKFDPEMLISVATLTGAVGVALGDRYCGVFSNDIAIRKELVEVGKEVDDLGWGLPLPKDYREKMKSKLADLRNYDQGTGRLAGSSKGAGFLSYFVGKNKWAHLDIGGTAFSSDPKPYQTPGATAHGLQMLIRFLEKH